MQHLLAFQNQQAVRAIVLLHGGGNDGGDVSATLSALTGASIPVFAVALGKRSDVPMLASFARGTGGAIYEARSRGDLASHLASILAGIDALRSGRRPAPTATPKTPTPKTAAPAPSPKPKPTGSRTLRCRNKANVTLTIEQVSGRAQIRLRRPIPKPKKGRTPKVAPLFAAIKSTDLKAQKEISAFAADLTLSQCRFSPDHVEVVGCSAESATMYRVTTKAGVQTLLASTLSLRTHRLEESNLDGKTYWVEARLDLGLNDPSKAGGGAGKTGALAIHRFKLSECR